MFADLPLSSSEPRDGKALFRYLLLHTARRWGWCSLRSRNLLGDRRRASSSLAEEERLRLLRFVLLASLAEAGAHQPLPSSLAHRPKPRLFARSSRTAARPPGSARRASDTDARRAFSELCSRTVLWPLSPSLLRHPASSANKSSIVSRRMSVLILPALTAMTGGRGTWL
jgi:hypothetical protein